MTERWLKWMAHREMAEQVTHTLWGREGEGEGERDE